MHYSACYTQKLDDETPAKITLIMITRKPHRQRTLELERNPDGSKHLKGRIFTRLDLIMMSLHQQERQIAGERLPPFQTEKIPELSVSSSRLWVGFQRTRFEEVSLPPLELPSSSSLSSCLAPLHRHRHLHISFYLASKSRQTRSDCQEITK
jgi:hypothetical protein